MNAKKIFSLLVICFIVIFALCVWYFTVYAKSPKASVEAVRTALSAHDVVTFQKHVNLDMMLSRLYENITGQKGDSAEKSAFVKKHKEEILTFVESGETDKEYLAKSELKEMSYSNKRGRTANVGIPVSLPYAYKDFVLDVVMWQTEDGTWQAVEISNPKDCPVGTDAKAAAEQLIEYAKKLKEIMEKSDAAIAEMTEKLDNEKEEYWAKGGEALRETLSEIKETKMPAGGRELLESITAYYENLRAFGDLRLAIIRGDDSKETQKKLKDFMSESVKANKNFAAILQGMGLIEFNKKK